MDRYQARQAYLPPGNFRSQDIDLKIAQEPVHCLLTIEGKEKFRKPVDPPPVVKLFVDERADPAQDFMQSPYLFMCVSLYKAEKNEPCDGTASKGLLGTLVSSLHRLKDTDNKDCAFFVFGDISVKVQGKFRLHFSLFDLQESNGAAQFLASATSQPFTVSQLKDFKGMDTSTYLSRAFSDQGVRLRLRKESRAVLGKRPNPYDAPEPTALVHTNIDYTASYAPDSMARQRPRTHAGAIRSHTYPGPTGTFTSQFAGNNQFEPFPPTNGYDTMQYSASSYQQNTVSPRLGSSQYQNTPRYTSSEHAVGQLSSSGMAAQHPPSRLQSMGISQPPLFGNTPTNFNTLGLGTSQPYIFGSSAHTNTPVATHPREFQENFGNPAPTTSACAGSNNSNTMENFYQASPSQSSASSPAIPFSGHPAGASVSSRRPFQDGRVSDTTVYNRAESHVPYFSGSTSFATPQNTGINEGQQATTTSAAYHPMAHVFQ